MDLNLQCYLQKLHWL